MKSEQSVDTLCLNTAGPIVAMQVLRKGRKIVERDSRRSVEFFVRTIGLYNDIKMVRRPIEQSILNGRIYGWPRYRSSEGGNCSAVPQKNQERHRAWPGEIGWLEHAGYFRIESATSGSSHDWSCCARCRHRRAWFAPRSSREFSFTHEQPDHLAGALCPDGENGRVPEYRGPWIRNIGHWGAQVDFE